MRKDIMHTSEASLMWGSRVANASCHWTRLNGRGPVKSGDTSECTESLGQRPLDCERNLSPWAWGRVKWRSLVKNAIQKPWSCRASTGKKPTFELTDRKTWVSQTERG